MPTSDGVRWLHRLYVDGDDGDGVDDCGDYDDADADDGDDACVCLHPDLARTPHI